MAAKTTALPVEAYLRMSFEGPEPDYVDGELVERHLGSLPHSNTQKRLLRIIDACKSGRVNSYPELTLRISATHYGVADIAVFEGSTPEGNYPTEPPACVIEIVSEDDRYVDILKKLEEYRSWGVARIWLADPWTRRFHVHDHSGLHEVGSLEWPEHEVVIRPADIFD